jgi:SNF2 family DNA or RNA helicase
MSFEKRDKIIVEFHAPGSPRVLIFSSVGAAGLNLSISDVVVMFVRILVAPIIYSY